MSNDHRGKQQRVLSDFWLIQKLFDATKEMQGLKEICYKPLLDVASNFNEICQKHFITRKTSRRSQ